MWWMRPMADHAIQREDIWLDLIERILSVYRSETQPVNDDPVGKAINHPVGQATEAVLHFWYRQKLEDNQGLPDRIGAILGRVCDLQVQSFRHGRVILAQAVITLFRVDRPWTTQHILPLFDWDAAHREARCAWEGFLWTPRIYFPFLEAIKAAFLATAAHYSELNKHAEQYAAFMTFVALEAGDTFSRAELAAAVSELPSKGLARSAQSLVAALQSAGDQTPEYWHNRIIPYLNDIWPKTVSLITNQISSTFAELCIAARDAFPNAYPVLKSWLQPLKRPEHAVHLLKEGALCERFPSISLSFLDSIVGDVAEWAPRDLMTCLTQLQTADPTLAEDQRFRRLRDYARQHNLGA
jgi:hypothetical protein